MVNCGADATSKRLARRADEDEGQRLMKRLHVHLAVESLAVSVRFYSALFAAQPTVLKADFARWMLEDPRLNFAISQRGAVPGIKHFGIQVEDRAELEEAYTRLRRTERPMVEEGQTTCCYAKSENSWTKDPQGVPWETFLTTGESALFGQDNLGPVDKTMPAWCTPCVPPECQEPRYWIGLIE